MLSKDAGEALRIPMRGYEQIASSRRTRPLPLRIPMRGYEIAPLKLFVINPLVTNPHAGL